MDTDAASVRISNATGTPEGRRRSGATVVKRVAVERLTYPSTPEIQALQGRMELAEGQLGELAAAFKVSHISTHS